MVSLNSVLNVLEKWERWKLLNQTPVRVDELEARIRKLEERLTALGDGKLLCKECGFGPITMETRNEPYGEGGEIQRIYRTCPECKAVDIKDGAILKKTRLQVTAISGMAAPYRD